MAAGKARPKEFAQFARCILTMLDGDSQTFFSEYFAGSMPLTALAECIVYLDGIANETENANDYDKFVDIEQNTLGSVPAEDVYKLLERHA